jgi:hypothetical protein
MTAQDIVAFLRARLDEDEQRATAALGQSAGEATGWLWTDVDAESPQEAHTANWSPVRVLREVDARRRVVDEHRSRGDRCRVCAAEANGYWRRFAAPCPTLMFLAEPYAGHPDYCGEWRP